MSYRRNKEDTKRPSSLQKSHNYAIRMCSYKRFHSWRTSATEVYTNYCCTQNNSLSFEPVVYIITQSILSDNGQHCLNTSLHPLISDLPSVCIPTPRLVWMINMYSTSRTRDGFKIFLSLSLLIAHCQICRAGWKQRGALTLGQVLEAIADARGPSVGCNCLDDGLGLVGDHICSQESSFWFKKIKKEQRKKNPDDRLDKTLAQCIFLKKSNGFVIHLKLDTDIISKRIHSLKNVYPFMDLLPRAFFITFLHHRMWTNIERAIQILQLCCILPLVKYMLQVGWWL